MSDSLRMKVANCLIISGSAPGLISSAGLFVVVLACFAGCNRGEHKSDERPLSRNAIRMAGKSQCLFDVIYHKHRMRPSEFDTWLEFQTLSQFFDLFQHRDELGSLATFYAGRLLHFLDTSEIREFKEKYSAEIADMEFAHIFDADDPLHDEFEDFFQASAKESNEFMERERDVFGK